MAVVSGVQCCGWCVPNNAPKPGTAAACRFKFRHTPTAATETSTPSTTPAQSGAIQCTPDDTVWSDGLHGHWRAPRHAPSRQATDGREQSFSRCGKIRGQECSLLRMQNATKVVTWNVREVTRRLMELEQAWVQLDDRWTTTPDLDVKERAGARVAAQS